MALSLTDITDYKESPAVFLTNTSGSHPFMAFTTTNLLMMYRQIILFCPENYTKHVLKQNATFLNVKTAGAQSNRNVCGHHISFRQILTADACL